MRMEKKGFEMVDSVNARTHALDAILAGGRVARSSTAEQLGVAVSPDAASQTEKQEFASIVEQLANKPPVNAEKVASIRAAIADGGYVVDANRLADAMLGSAFLLPK